MTKKAKILILLSCVFFLLILYLIFTAEPIKKMEQSKNDLNNSMVEQLSKDYKERAGVIFASYLKLIENNDYTVDEIKQMKNKLLELKVPTNFKDLHINLVLALTKMENYLSDGEESEKLESMRLINQAKVNYSWLYN